MAMTTNWDFDGADELLNMFGLTRELMLQREKPELPPEWQLKYYKSFASLLVVGAFADMAKEFHLNRGQFLRDQDDHDRAGNFLQRRLDDLPKPTPIQTFSDFGDLCRVASDALLSISIVQGEILQLLFHSEDPLLHMDRNRQLSMIRNYDPSQLMRVLRATMMNLADLFTTEATPPEIEVTQNLDLAVAEIRRIAAWCRIELERQEPAAVEVSVESPVGTTKPSEEITKRGTAKPEGTDKNDASVYVPFKTLYNLQERYDTTRKMRTAVLAPENKVRTYKPSKNRLNVHAGDWAKHLEELEERENAAMDEESMQERIADIEARKRLIKKRGK